MGWFACSLLSLVLGFAITTPAAAQTLVEKGNVLYHNRCAGCHGEELPAFAGGPASHLRRLRPDERDRLVESVIRGTDTMPSWSGRLKTDAFNAVWGYIRATVDR